MKQSRNRVPRMISLTTARVSALAVNCQLIPGKHQMILGTLSSSDMHDMILTRATQVGTLPFLQIHSGTLYLLQ
jgi:hypothetical protein